MTGRERIRILRDRAPETRDHLRREGPEGMLVFAETLPRGAIEVEPLIAPIREHLDFKVMGTAVPGHDELARLGGHGMGKRKGQVLLDPTLEVLPECLDLPDSLVGQRSRRLRQVAEVPFPVGLRGIESSATGFPFGRCHAFRIHQTASRRDHPILPALLQMIESRIGPPKQLRASPRLRSRPPEPPGQTDMLQIRPDSEHRRMDSEHERTDWEHRQENSEHRRTDKLQILSVMLRIQLPMLPIQMDLLRIPGAALQGARTLYLQHPSKRPNRQPNCQSQRDLPSRVRSMSGVFTSSLAQRRTPGSQPRRGMPRPWYFL